jgi:hypothetical protein
MARVTLTPYEYENDLLPMVCAKCGQPADARVRRPIRFVGRHRRLLLETGIVLGLLFFPALFLWVAFSLGQVIWVRIPVCETHYDDWKWRDRATHWFLIPAWTLSVLVLYAISIVFLVKGDPNSASAVLSGVPIAIVPVVLIENLVVLFRAVRLTKSGTTNEVRLSGVHEDFAAALIEDRARQRVDDPERRRSPQGDVRDDYDDEAV